VPIEPPPSRWEFPSPLHAGDRDLIGYGADLEPGTLLQAYRRGLFPMPIRLGGAMVWWSPQRRGVLPLDGLKVSRSLRQSCKKFEIRINTAFGEVIRACANPEREGAWISSEVIEAYEKLHELGWAHSVEAWTRDGRLGGGLYGVAVGGLFAGESMFHHVRDASKVALVALVDILKKDDHGKSRILDLQWVTPHLESLGAIQVPREDYLRLLEHAIRLPPPAEFADPPGLSTS